MSEDQPANGAPNQQHRMPSDIYWDALVQIKGSCETMELYCKSKHRWVQGIDTVKAIASSSSIAAWVVWKDLGMVWAFVIALSQVIDALKGVFPFAKDYRSGLALKYALDALFLDAETTWYSYANKNANAKTILADAAKLKKAALAAEHKHFPDGLNYTRRFKALAEASAQAYILSMKPESE